MSGSRRNAKTRFAVAQVATAAAPDLLGLALVVVAGLCVLAPALLHGTALGPFDLLARNGLTQHAGVTVHNSQTTDQITEMIPWTVLNWTQVHHGHLPLWDPYNALGIPQLFNWQSAGFSVPSLIGYLFPLRFAFTVGVLSTVVISGVGVYVFGRVLKMGVLACATAGIVFELSGPMMGFSGWPIAGVLCWAGWLFAATVLILRGRRRVASIALFGVVLASAFFAGQPGTVAVLLAAIAVFVVVTVVLRGWRAGAVKAALRGALDLVVAVVVGGALAAPLLLPGSQLLGPSIFRTVQRINTAFPLQDVVYLILQGFSGQVPGRTQFFDVGVTTYVGVIALVLAVAGICVSRRRPETLGLGAVALVMAGLLYLPPVLAFVNKLPLRPRPHVGAVVMDMAIAVLAGIGIDALVRWRGDRLLVGALGWGFGAAALVLAFLWIVGRGTLPPANARIRAQSFAWPAGEVALGLVVVALLLLVLRHSPGQPPREVALKRPACLALAGSLLVCETAFLVAVGAGVWPSSPTFFPKTPAVTALQRAVGSSLVGFGARSCQTPPTLGILQEANIAYGVREFAAYDPLAPREYFTSWEAASGQTATDGDPPVVFCPVVNTVALARLYGVGFVLEPKGAAGPTGSTFDATVGDEGLYRIPGAAQATLGALLPSGQMPNMWAVGSPVAVEHSGDASMKMNLDAQTQSVLRIRVPDLPGWHATIDGRALATTRFAGLMLQAQVPPGQHSVELSYGPKTFNDGVELSLAALVLLGLGLVGSWLTGRGRRARATSDPTMDAAPTARAAP